MSDFENLLDIYYRKYFPHNLLYRWLSYNQDPKETNFFHRREFSYTLENDIYVRYQSFENQAKLASSIVQKRPYKIDIGAVFTAPPAEHKTIAPGKFKPVERELVFDIDLTDYDDVRTCCSGASVCNSCWLLMNAAIRVMDDRLREDFGYEHVVWVFSGRRGVHCWVSDDKARALKNEGRAAVVEYFSTVSGASDEASQVNVDVTDPPHPMHKRAYQLLEDTFLQLSGDEHQGWLGSDPNKRAKLETMIPEEIPNSWLSEDNPEDKWAKLRSLIKQESDRKSTTRQKEAELKKLEMKIVFAFVYPRIDINVTKTQNHLLKSPFCVHPKTEKVCVPLTINDLDTFFPDRVPTLSSVIEEGTKIHQAAIDEAKEEGVPLYRHTSLQPFFDNFEKDFLRPMEIKIKKTQIQKRKNQKAEQEAFTGQF
eukprot:gb/GECG01010232.1/.p1 GENE.gb/GECG01010232.1/~~gb/GECG01010232.1/.p1  ORF type:complete len:424 (+),score=58.83 gb/GECG01010232.1/:1-1272(+)